jgi:hypothetical protein
LTNPVKVVEIRRVEIFRRTVLGRKVPVLKGMARIGPGVLIILRMRRPEKDFETSTLPRILELLERSSESLELEVEALQEAQAMVPAPDRLLVARMRQGALPLSRTAYLLGRLQRAIVAVENVASDLRADLEQGFGDVESVELVEADYNAIEEAVTRLTPS